MLSPAHSPDDAWFEDLRRREFVRLDGRGQAYLDYAGSALYAASQVQAYADWLNEGVFGNPHSEHQASRDSTGVLDEARRAALALFDVDETTHVLCFTANTSAAIKLVAESYPFGPARGLVLAADNHNSVNGMREFARAAGARVGVLPLDAGLRLDDAAARLEQAGREGEGLFAFPVQSNFSGVRHPLALVEAAQAQGFDVLIDAAAACSTPLSLKRCPAQFTVISFYKMFGLPTGVGALIARRDALERLKRPWFAGGTVDFVSVQHGRHQLRAGHEGFEDGTPNFLGAGAIVPGLELLKATGVPRIGARVARLTADFLARLEALTHADGSPLVRVYGPPGMQGRGGTVAFNLLGRSGATLPYADVEARAREQGVAMRGGCFCNPGAAEAAFGFGARDTTRCFDQLGAAFTIERFAACLGEGAAVGAVRASFGLANNGRDIDRAIEVVASFAERRRDPARSIA